jgi:hypothetical protein
VMLLKQNQEHLEDDLRGFKIRNREYEEGLYGLPQVMSGWCVVGGEGGQQRPWWCTEFTGQHRHCRCGVIERQLWDLAGEQAQLRSGTRLWSRAPPDSAAPPPAPMLRPWTRSTP